MRNEIAWTFVVLTMVGGCDQKAPPQRQGSASKAAAGSAPGAAAVFESLTRPGADIPKAVEGLDLVDAKVLRAASYSVPEPLERRVFIDGREIDLSVATMRPMLEAAVRALEGQSAEIRARRLIALDSLFAGVMRSAAGVRDRQGQGGSAWLSATLYRAYLMDELERVGAAADAYEPAKKKEALTRAAKALDSRGPIP